MLQRFDWFDVVGEFYRFLAWSLRGRSLRIDCRSYCLWLSRWRPSGGLRCRFRNLRSQNYGSCHRNRESKNELGKKTVSLHENYS